MRHHVSVDLRWMTTVEADTIVAASHLFDYEVRPEWAQRFLAQPDHHLGIAYVDGSPAGFISGVEVTHPDKGTEMFLNELAVDATFQRRGIGNALVRALADRARERGCYGMWVLTEAANPAALATYISSGADDRGDHVMLTWRLDPTHQTFTNPS
jgi:ribosomal protein S18 acetylase RimI-like enzyme